MKGQFDYAEYEDDYFSIAVHLGWMSIGDCRMWINDIVFVLGVVADFGVKITMHFIAKV
jgi:hypothetical protein